MANPAVVIIISGPSASGKTTVGEVIAKHFRLPFFRKDAIKELLFDALGWSDRDWSRKMGQTTYRLLDYIGEAQLKSGQSFIIESNFKTTIDPQRFERWQQEFGIKLVQVHCWAEIDTLRKRFNDRVQSGSRHPGHVDQQNTGIFDDPEFNETFAALAIDGPTIEYDTTRHSSDQADKLLEKLRPLLQAQTHERDA